MFLDKCKVFPKNRILYIIAVVGFLIILLLYLLVFIPIESMVSTYGILDYEFAWNSEQVETIFEVWDYEGINSQKIAIYWDFLFIVGYVSLAFSLIVLVLRKSENSIQTIGTYIVITPFLTGIFDIIENVNLLIMDITFITNGNAFIASLSATIKFGLLFVGIIYFIGALIHVLINKIKNRNG
ncbi:MAG: hypothetical protein KGD65_10585 [Candidatus Lokiarchaeota archaeon]|nr:hypothetical protein [Candidatus Lokiarchaeota archaeon]